MFDLAQGLTPGVVAMRAAAGLVLCAPALAAAPAADIPPPSDSPRIEIADSFHLRSASDPQFSPDGKRVLFAVQYSDRAGMPYTRIWIADPGAGGAKPWGGGAKGRREGRRAGRPTAAVSPSSAPTMAKAVS